MPESGNDCTLKLPEYGRLMKLGNGVEICAVQRYAEPEYLLLAQTLFTHAGLIVPTRAPTPRPADARMIRIGAYAPEGALVGWSWGWFLDDVQFYVASSAVTAGFRQQGLHRTLTQVLLSRAVTYGATFVESKHAVANAPILNIKRRMGFVELRREQHEEMGALIVLGRNLPLTFKIV